MKGWKCLCITAFEYENPVFTHRVEHLYGTFLEPVRVGECEDMNGWKQCDIDKLIIFRGLFLATVWNLVSDYSRRMILCRLQCRWFVELAGGLS